MTTRNEVYAAIDSEREYQNKWSANGRSDDHEIETWLVYMDTYLRKAKDEASKTPDKSEALNMIRKVTALGVVCMEQHGAPHR
jgi:hypothetical protein